jgi:hypothetical protein
LRLATDSIVVETHFDEQSTVELVAAIEVIRRLDELVDRAEVGVGDLLFVIIHTDNVMTNLREAGPRSLGRRILHHRSCFMIPIYLAWKSLSWKEIAPVPNLLPALVVIPVR